MDVFAIAPVDRNAAGVAAANPVDLLREIRFCTAPDGVQLAYSMIGQGPPLMKTGNWMTHLEFDLESPIWRHLYMELARNHTLIRYDARGYGLSDRAVEDISFAGAIDVSALLPRVSADRPGFLSGVVTERLRFNRQRTELLNHYEQAIRTWRSHLIKVEENALTGRPRLRPLRGKGAGVAGNAAGAQAGFSS